MFSIKHIFASFTIFLLIVLVQSRLDKDEGVYVVTNSNWEEMLDLARDNNAALLLEFYAPWCGHCKNLAPEYAKAAGRLEKDEEPLIYLAKCDATENTQLAQSFEVQGYPTLFTYRNEYGGGRTADDIISYMKNVAGGPKPKKIATAEDVQKAIEKANAVIVLGIFKSESESLFAEYLDLAKKYYAFKFIYTFDSDTCHKYDLSEDQNHVLLLRDPKYISKKDPAHLNFEHDEHKDGLEKFFLDNILLDVDVLDEKTIPIYDTKKKPMLTLLFDLDWKNKGKQALYYINRLKKIAKEYADKIVFNFGHKSDHGKTVSKLGLQKEYNILITDKDKQHHLFEKDVVLGDSSLNAAEIKHFIEDYFTGKIEPYIKSEQIPDQNEDDVEILVGKTIGKLVKDTGRNSLIEFYAPWCGHCKTLAPVWSKLATAVRGQHNLVIAKLDATSNDFPDIFDVKGFPTLYWVPKDGEPEKYSGGRDLKDFINFLKNKGALDSLRDEL